MDLPKRNSTGISLLLPSKVVEKNIEKKKSESSTVSANVSSTRTETFSNPLHTFALSVRKVVTMDDEPIEIVGHEDIRTSIENIFLLMNNLKNPIRSDLLCRNFLFVGLGGVGKTQTLRGIAVSAARLIKRDISFFNLSATNLTSKYVGESSKMISAVFDIVEEYAPSIILIDELDGLLKQRTEDESDATRQVKTALLSEIRGNRELKKVVIVATTNFPWQLDTNIPGRFPHKHFCRLPNFEERRLLLELFVSRLSKSTPVKMNDIDFKAVAYSTNGYSGSDVQTVVGIATEDMSRILLNGVIYTKKDLGNIRKELENQTTPAEVYLSDLTTKMLLEAATQVKPTINGTDLKKLVTWAHRYTNMKKPDAK